MGLTIQYTTVTEWELQPILAGGAKDIVAGILRECKQQEINPRFRQNLESLLKEFWDAPENHDAKQKLDFHLREEYLQFQKQYLSGSRLAQSSKVRNSLRSQNDDPSVRVDELCEFYASGGYMFLHDKEEERRTAEVVRTLLQEQSLSRYQADQLSVYRKNLDWYDKLREIGISQSELVEETRKRGLRFVLDLGKDFRNLHPLLAGEHYYADPEPNDLLSLALYGESDVPADSCPAGGVDKRDSSGYGPPRYTSSATVKDIRAFFGETNFEDLVRNNGLDSETDWAGRYEFDCLKSFYLSVAEAEDGVLVFFQ